jgi:hypothetical protein
MKLVGILNGKLAVAGFLLGCVLAVGRIPASAGLGGDAASIDSDVSATAGKMSETTSPQGDEQSAAYSAKSFVTGNGVTVHEYSANSGPVFGVAWQGRRPPDLSVLLGSYYPEYAAAVAAHQGPIALHRAVISGPDVIVSLSGHMGHVVGRAYVPSLVPSGIDPKAVVK